MCCLARHSPLSVRNECGFEGGGERKRSATPKRSPTPLFPPERAWGRGRQNTTGRKNELCDGRHSFPSDEYGTTSLVGVKWRDVRPREIAMITTRYRMFGAVGLLLCVLSTAALASVSKPTAEERAACMGDAMTLCVTAIPNRARIASCLASKMSQLSPRCRAQFDRAATGR